MNKKLFEEIKEGLDSLTEEMAEKLLNSISSEKKDMFCIEFCGTNMSVRY